MNKDGSINGSDDDDANHGGNKTIFISSLTFGQFMKLGCLKTE